MRAARLLHILRLLQNRGRMTALALAAELEVHPRTIQRDIGALTEAGWRVSGRPLSAPVPQQSWGDINISRSPVDISPPRA